MSETLVNLVGLSIFAGSPLMAIGIGVVYFVKAEKPAALWVRLLSSAFGPSVALLFPMADVLWPEKYGYTTAGVRAYSRQLARPAVRAATRLHRDHAWRQRRQPGL